jgi:hypothetical protein
LVTSNDVFNEFISSDVSSLSIVTINTDLDTFSNNNGFIPSTVITQPDYFPVKIEIRGPTDDGASWQFDSEGGISLPGGGYIGTNDYDGSILIAAGNKINLDQESGNVQLQDGSEYSQIIASYDYARLSYERNNESQVTVNDYGVSVENNTAEWIFRGDSGSYVGAIRDPGYDNYTIVRNQVSVQSNQTDRVIWIARDYSITSGKFTVQVSYGSANNDNNFDTMTCDIVLAAKRVDSVNSLAKVSVYGLIYTSTDPLATFDATVIPGGTYTVNQSANGYTSGSGTGASFIIQAHANGSYYTINSRVNGGTGYKVNDTITIFGSYLGGIATFSNSNDLVIRVTSVNVNGTITDQDIDYTLSGYTNAGKVAITCTPAAGLSRQIDVKIRGTESGSATTENYC